MPDHWLPARLDHHVDLLTGFPFKSPQYCGPTDGIRLLRGDNVVQRDLRWDGAKYWPTRSAGEFVSYGLRPGDVVLAMDRPWIEAGLKVSALRDADCPSLLVQRVARLRARHGLDQGFLKWLLYSQSFTDHVLAVQTGTAVPHISGQQIRDYRFFLPALPAQRRIAGVLGALDDFIDTNRELQTSLEAARRAIMAEAISGSIIRVRLADVAEHLPGKYLKKSEYEGGGRYVVFGSNSVMGMHASYLYEGPLSILARIGSNCGALALSVEPAWINNNASAMRSKSRADNYWLHGVLEQVDMDRHRGGSGQPFIRIDSLMATEIPWLEKPDLARVERGLAELARAGHALAVESQDASGARDELLPLLLSGRVRVEDVAA